MTLEKAPPKDESMGPGTVVIMEGPKEYAFRLRFRDGAPKTLREYIVEPIVNGKPTKTLYHLTVIGNGFISSR